ncbi:class I SAM-dependent methyltransferase [Candidatus Bathyarchaeota archaeon]|nr:class I SAM-dependent methyltransferase [Candidatus Bathyarchaeota archaeon]
MSGSHYFSSKPTVEDRRGLIRTILRGKQYEFITSRGVFSSKRIDNGTRILAENMILPKGGRLLDMGCGIGILGIVAARERADLEVVMSDINQRAVELTRLNAKRNKVSNFSVHEGHLYESLGDIMFDTIISNPPISAGMRKVVFPLVRRAKERLVEGGTLQLVIQSKKGGKMLARAMDETFGEHTVLTRKSGYRILFADTS